MAYGITYEQVQKVRGISAGQVLRGDYSIIQQDDCVILMQHDNFLAAGTTAEVLLYAFAHHPGAVRLVLNAARNGIYVKDRACDRADINVALDFYRQVRAAVPSLNKLTKLCQLPAIDYDHVYQKFSGADTGVAAVVGSGVFGGTHFFQSEPVDLYDSAIRYEGGDYDRFVKSLAADVPCQDYDVLVSDVALGDDMGMTKGSTFYKVPEKVKAYVKLNLADTDGPRGYVFRKPRPHNLEVIWRIDADGELWETARNRLISEVIMANERRNDWVLRMRLPDVKLKSDVSQERLTMIAFRPWSLPPPRKGRTLRKKPDQVVASRLGSRPYKRYKAFCEALKRVPPKPEVKEYCLLPPSQIKLGPACFQDPEVASVDYSARSLIYSAAVYHFKAYRKGWEWFIGV